ncbi:MAG: alkaline phosphatase D family protein, partial [Planctomycetota bacterium]
AILSNGSPDMLDGAVKSAGIGDVLDDVLSVQSVGVFKPHKSVYDLVGARFGERRTLTLTAREAATGAVLSTAYLEGAPETAFDGSVALVSHRGPAVDPSEGRPFGYAFRRWELAGDLVARDDGRAFGPLLFVHYSVDESGADPVLRLVAQAAPLGATDGRTATLEILDEGGRARTVATARLDPDARTFSFVVPGGFDPYADTRFEVVHVPHDANGELAPRRTQRYGGVIPARPTDGVLDIALLSCQKSFTGGLRWNEEGFWFPHADVARGVDALEPDLLYFAGDQIYEGDVTPAVRAPEHEALLDYLGKWYRHGWSFGELTRSVPSVVTPDDHDVYHGNIWGNAGVALEAPDGRTLSAQDRGGYTMSARFVNAVHRTQTGHLPPPVDPSPLANGVLPFHTTLSYGGGSFAILSDRMYKSPPAVVVPDGAIVNGWATDPDWDARKSSDVPGAELLGASQETLLERWGSAPARGTEWFRAVLSQTPFVNLATLPAGARTGAAIPGMSIADRGAYMAGDRPAQDMDSGGWPRTARDRAVGLLRDARAFHLAGDQHLASVVRYGVEEFDDAPFVFTAPAVANTWPRRWFPNPRDRAPRGTERSDAAGAEAEPPYTGRYLDGFGNRMTVHAVANPRRTELEPTRLNDRVPGFGAVRVRRVEGAGGAEVTFTAWPRWEVPTEPGARPYGGWPVRTVLPPLERR